MNKLGVYIIKNSKGEEWKSRLESLSNQVEHWTNPNNKTSKTVKIIQLFYNDK